MKIVALSDFHGRLVEVPKCDLCIIAGDFCPIEDHGIQFQQAWLERVFHPWLASLPAKKIIGVAGNHDIIYDHGTESGFPPPELPWTYLQNNMIEYEGVKIFGTPYQAKFNGWPFMRTEWELEKLWADMPKCDILVSHGPPFFAGDLCYGRNNGMKTLHNKILELKPQYCICGHIHECFGEFPISDTKVLNVALCDNAYNIQYQPVEFEI